MSEGIKPLVSVMMPAYNAEQFIEKAVLSVLAQDYLNWELIIVNDGSTDRTAEIIARFSDPRIKVFTQINQGEAAARNLALEKMQGDYVAFLDSDDEFHPRFLIETAGFLDNNPQYDAAYSDGWHIDLQNNRLEPLSAYRRGPFNGNLFEELVLASDVFGPPICTLLKRSIIVDMDLRFDQRIVIGPDWDFMTRYAAAANFAFIDKKLCNYRVHQTNITVLTGSEKRRQSLAICREKAIHHPGFPNLNESTRKAVFYDYLVNLIFDQEEKSAATIDGTQFNQLSVKNQSWLLRLTAAKILLSSEDDSIPKRYLSIAVRKHKMDIKTLVMWLAVHVQPDFLRGVLNRRRKQLQNSWGRTPFQIQSNE